MCRSRTIVFYGAAVFDVVLVIFIDRFIGCLSNNPIDHNDSRFFQALLRNCHHIARYTVNF